MRLKRLKKNNNKKCFTPIKFLDAFKVEHEAVIDNSLQMHNYDINKFKRNGNLMSYEDETYTSRVGIDVGIYFYLQAITVKEALEEADFVLKKLQD